MKHGVFLTFRSGHWRSWLVLFALGFMNLSAFVAQGQEESSKPNVILIFTDDQGSLDLNCFGSKDLHTPHLDELALQGVKFTQFYVAAPVCSPSRAGLLTGRYPIRAGVPGNVSSQPNHEGGLPMDEVTFGEMFQKAGYRTALFGKWHLGTALDFSPNAQGFHEFLGHKGGCIDNYSHYFYWSGPHFHDLWRNEKEHYENGTHLSALMVREAQRFLRENQDRPFFLFLPFNLPHYPTQTPVKFRQLYKEIEEPRRSYASTISYIDHNVGRILRTVDELQLGEKTIVVYLSDHGHSTEERTGFGGGNAGPYRGAKFSVFEGGIRVPCIIRWRGHIPANEERNQMAISLDWYPTLAELCNISLPDKRIDGRSLVPVLKSAVAESPHKTLFWQLGNQWAVREGPWKLVVNGRDNDREPPHRVADVFLSNLDKSLSETNNLAADNQAIVERLTRYHRDWLREIAP